jgi:hypothetical protein
MRLEVVEVSPKKAREWLDNSRGQRQRPLKKTVVTRLSHAIDTDQWRLTHQAIALDTNEIVIDGQHRLTAIANAGKTVPCLIAFESESETFDVIDTGTARSAADTISIAGYAQPNNVAAIARMLLAYDVTRGNTISWQTARGTATTSDVMELLSTERGDRVLNALSYGTSIGTAWGRPGYRTWVAAVLVIIAESKVPDELGAEFIMRLQDGASLASGSPILALRRYVMSDAGLRNVPAMYRQPVGIAVTIKALNGWIAQDTRNHMVFKPGVEKMPEPIWFDDLIPMAPKSDPARVQQVDLVSR